MSLLTGGSVASLLLAGDGSGVCWTRGGVHFLIAIAGYVGAPICGVWFYGIGKTTTMPGDAQRNLKILAGIIVAVSCFWARDGTTWAISCFLLCLLYLMGKHIDDHRMRVFVRFTGLYVMLNAVHSPLYTMQKNQSFGDAANLEKLTGLPGGIFAALWVGFALSLLISMVWIPWTRGHEIT